MEDISQDEKGKYVFHQLIQKEGDYVGMIAYSLYKQNKIDFIINHKKRNGGERPSDEELKKFQESHCLESQLKLYRNNAESITSDFFNLLFEEKRNQLERKSQEIRRAENSLNEKERIIISREKNIKLREKHCNMKPRGTFVKGVMQSLLASFIFLIITIIIVFVIDKQIDIVNSIRTLLNK